MDARELNTAPARLVDIVDQATTLRDIFDVVDIAADAVMKDNRAMESYMNAVSRDGRSTRNALGWATSELYLALRRHEESAKALHERACAEPPASNDTPILEAFRAWVDTCTQHRAKFETGDVPDEVANRMCGERHRLWRDLMALPAATAAGMAAKAYAAADFHGDGIEAPEDDDHSYEAEAARAVIADAKRLLPSDLLRGMAS